MRLIKPSYEVWQQPPGLEGVYKQIERVGRICYKSEDKITEDSAKPFVDRMIKSGHGAMLEHGTVYLAMPLTILSKAVSGWGKYTNNPYSKGFKVCEIDGQRRVAITTNLRVLVKNNWLEDLKYLCEPTEFHEKRVTVRFTTSNGIMREFTRHRSHSFAVESTRYCNYSKNKFNNEITFIQPYWFTHDYTKKYLNKLIILKHTPNDNYTSEENLFLTHLLDVEEKYMGLINLGLKAQEAREVLPLATKCDMVMTGFISDWQHFFSLRTSIIAETGKPHPDASALADPLYKEFVERGYIADKVEQKLIEHDNNN